MTECPDKAHCIDAANPERPAPTTMMSNWCDIIHDYRYISNAKTTSTKIMKGGVQYLGMLKA